MSSSPFRAIIKILVWKNVITEDEGKLFIEKGLANGSLHDSFERLVNKLINEEKYGSV